MRAQFARKYLTQMGSGQRHQNACPESVEGSASQIVPNRAVTCTDSCLSELEVSSGQLYRTPDLAALRSIRRAATGSGLGAGV